MYLLWFPMQLENLQLLVGQPTTKATQGSSVCFPLVFLFIALLGILAGLVCISCFNKSERENSVLYSFQSVPACSFWICIYSLTKMEGEIHGHRLAASTKSILIYVYVFSSKILFDLVRFLFNLGCRTAVLLAPVRLPGLELRAAANIPTQSVYLDCLCLWL